MMIDERTKEELKERLPDYLEMVSRPTKKGGKDAWECPLCGSGSKNHHTGGLQYYPKTQSWYCFSCGKGGDIFSLIGEVEHLDGFSAEIERAAEIFHVSIAHVSIAEADRKKEPAKSPAADRKECDVKNAAEDAEETPDYSEYLDRCRGNIENPEAVAYLAKRGISLDTAKMCGSGYDEEADPASNPGGAGVSKVTSKRLIIPSGNGCYLGRRIDGVEKYAKITAGKPHPFNCDALYSGYDVVYITEGAINAMSILEAGYPAAALNAATYVGAMIDVLKDHPTKSILLLVPDNDDAGRAAMEKLVDALSELKISHKITPIGAGRYKDANDFLVADRGGFVKELDDAYSSVMYPDSITSYILSGMQQDVKAFKESNRRTGFKELDRKSGGLYAGFYIVAAISSLGKTTFIHQLADQIATKGESVIFFSLEQSRLELATKSIARQLKRDNPCSTITSLDIRNGLKSEAVDRAAAEYTEKVRSNLSIVEGNYNCTCSNIRSYVESYINRTHSHPVVIIDYLQVIQGEEKYKSDKRAAIDIILTDIKRMSRDLNVTIIAISSVNRQNYATPIDFESLKESGNIEYTADVVWGLQLRCLTDPLFREEKKAVEKRDRIKREKGKTPRELQLVSLKNRYGRADFTVNLDYYPANDYIIESDSDDFHPDMGENPFK